jgi:hypothetical protein
MQLGMFTEFFAGALYIKSEVQNIDVHQLRRETVSN